MRHEVTRHNAPNGRFDRTVGFLVALLLAAPLSTVARAQATWLIESLIPEVLSVRVPSTTISFAIGGADYPPSEFPARYPATEPTGGALPVQVFSNADGVWSLLLQVPDLMGAAGEASVPANQLLYRVNGGVWLRADGAPQVIYTHAGPTVGWLELSVEFALELTGSEPAGSYLINAQLSALREPTY